MADQIVYGIDIDLAEQSRRLSPTPFILFTGIASLIPVPLFYLNGKLVKYIGKINELPEHAIHMSRCKVSGCEFSTKSDE